MASLRKGSQEIEFSFRNRTNCRTRRKNMGTRAKALIVGGLFFFAGCSGAAQEQTSTSKFATGDSTAAEESTTSTSSASTNPTSSPSTDTDDMEQVCTEIGCTSLLTIELNEVDITPNATFDIEICVDKDCATENIAIDKREPGTGEITHGESHSTHAPGRMLVWVAEDRIDYYLPGEEYPESATVTFSLVDNADGSVLAQTATEVPLERSQPNGPDCPPVCFFGRMIV